MLLVCGALLFGLWHFGLRALTNLPAKDELQQASSSVAARTDRPTASDGPRRTAAIEAPDASPAGAAAPAAASAAGPRERQGNVRFIEKDGIVGIHIDGPLERAPAKVIEAPPPPPPVEEPDLYRLVIIDSAGMIDVRTHKIRLAGVEAPEAEANCTRADGTTWPCGRRARTEMRRLIRRRAIACEEPDAEKPDDGNPPPAVRTAGCTVAGTDLSRWLVEQGWAVPTPGAPADWQPLHETAKAEGRGLYSPRAR